MELPHNEAAVIYCVGGGPSLRGFPWRVLEDKYVIAVNRAFEILPKAQIVYFTDLRFWNWYSKKLLEHSGQKVTIAKVAHSSVFKCHCSGSHGLDLTPGKLRHGNNSGYGAINLAVQLGARQINLLGYDMHAGPNGESHWHNGYPAGQRKDVHQKMAVYYDSLAKALEEQGVSVLNLCSDSALTQFPRVDWREHFGVQTKAKAVLSVTEGE